MENTSPAVFSAIAKVQSALAKQGIQKARKNAQQGYAFRGIDDVYGALAPLLAEHGLCIIPRVLSRTCTERQTKNGSAIFYTCCDVEYTVAAVADGSTITARIMGEAMDSGDKSTNKAMSAAYKYLALQLFCIPTEGDNDADATTHEVAAKHFDMQRFLNALAGADSIETAKRYCIEALRRAPASEHAAIREATDGRMRDLGSAE